jgi:hypothetical protein
MVSDLVRISSACSPTFLASGSCLSRASLVMTLSGVLRACARLPTWVRARSTISRLDWIRALSSCCSGPISVASSPSSLSASPPDGAQRREPEPDLEQRCYQEAKPEHPKRSDQHHAEFSEILVDLRCVPGDSIGIGCGLGAGRLDLALDDAQALILRARRVGTPDEMLVGGGALLARQLELLVEQGVGDEDRPLGGAFERLDLPIPA